MYCTIHNRYDGGIFGATYFEISAVYMILSLLSLSHPLCLSGCVVLYILLRIIPSSDILRRMNTAATLRALIPFPCMFRGFHWKWIIPKIIIPQPLLREWKSIIFVMLETSTRLSTSIIVFNKFSPFFAVRVPHLKEHTLHTTYTFSLCCTLN